MVLLKTYLDHPSHMLHWQLNNMNKRRSALLMFPEH